MPIAIAHPAKSSAAHQHTSNPMPPLFGIRFGKTAEPFPASTPLSQPKVRPQRKAHLVNCLKNLMLIPVLPLIGYYGLDVTGVTGFITHHHPALTQIMGEGFGHAGLCFSLHYVVNAGKSLVQAFKPGIISGSSCGSC